MDAQRLSLLLDSIIDDMLALRKQRLESHHQLMRVILSGDDLTTLPTTLECLAALDRCGYLLLIASSHSARESSLQSSCLQALAQRGIDAISDNREPSQVDESCSGFYFPALSSNSLSKIALGIRDNLVCRWAFHALGINKTVIVTLNAECLPDKDNSLPQALRARLASYADTLAEYGFTVIGRHSSGAKQMLATGAHKQLITLSEVRQYQKGQTLHIGHRTLITPAARDEIRDRGLVIVQSPQEDTCIWQR
jgi:hypothetical protein